jgi:hypothetical protein
VFPSKTSEELFNSNYQKGVNQSPLQKMQVQRAFVKSYLKNVPFSNYKKRNCFLGQKLLFDSHRSGI